MADVYDLRFTLCWPFCVPQPFPTTQQATPSTTTATIITIGRGLRRVAAGIAVLPEDTRFLPVLARLRVAEYFGCLDEYLAISFPDLAGPVR
jgi:hypothetical protein